MKFYSQLGQDQFLLENFFRGKRGGIFVDIGAYDGETFSNTLFFERFMGWSGLCVEPLPSAFAKLKTVRRATCERVCVADFEGEAEFVEADAGVDEKMLSGLAEKFDERHRARLGRVATGQRRWHVPVLRLGTLLERHGLRHVDYCSIDTEGAELSILSQADLDRFHISVLTVENNYDDERIPRLMTEKGYVLAAKIEQDYIFRRKDVRMLPRVCAICTVPSGMRDRDALLEGLWQSLARQTIAVEPIYVFANGEVVPQWLEGRAVASGADLTRAQAINLALSLVDTPFAMTLDLADRLAPDAAEILMRELQATNAVAVHGDGKLCASRTEADATVPCYDSTALEPSLRAAAGETFGPFEMWRLDAHLRVPRYPWRLRDGSLLHDAAQIAWRAILAGQGGGTIAHVPFVVGHTLTSAIGRGASERALLHDPGLSIL